MKEKKKFCCMKSFILNYKSNFIVLWIKKFWYIFLGEVLGFENLVFSIFDFINTLIESSKYRHHVKNGMADLLYYTLLFMQMTEDQVSFYFCYFYDGVKTSDFKPLKFYCDK